MKLKLFITCLAITCLTIVVSTSCEKKTDCKFTLKTLDSAGVPLANAVIKLYANVKVISISVNYYLDVELKTDD